jgi:hypothetical protein
MKPSIACLTVFLCLPLVTADGKKAQLVPARVVIAGKTYAFVNSTNVRVALRGDEDIQKKIAEALKEVNATGFNIDAKTGVVIALPKTFNKNNAFKLLGKRIAVEGILTSTDDGALFLASGSKGVKRVPLLIATKITEIDAKNKDSFPAENHAAIEGVARKGPFKVGAETVEWAIQNANGRIPFTLPKGAKPPEAGARLRVSGKVRVVEGELVLNAVTMSAGK